MATKVDPQRVTLTCKEGGANKQYTLWIEPSGDGFLVQAQYGAIGGTVQSAQKTPTPVSLEKAMQKYTSLLKEKMGKGYTHGTDAPAFSQVTDAVDSGFRPMLLTDASVELGPDFFCMSDNWAAQEKMNGKRIILAVNALGAYGVNRRGLQCPIPVQVAQEAAKLADGHILDGELIGDVYHAFDLLRKPGRDLTGETTVERFVQLGAALSAPDPSVIRLVPLVSGRQQKMDLVFKLRASCKEGVVFKRLDARYVPGRVNSLQAATMVKCKFYSEVQAVVIGWTDKQSIEVGLSGEMNGDTMKIVSVGRVTVPDKYVNQITTGRTVRVRYLYATEAKKLYQPTLDADSAGSVRGEMTFADPISSLKFEGKED